MNSNPSPTTITTPEVLQHSTPYTPLPDHPTSSAASPAKDHLRPFKGLAGIFLSMLFMSSMITFFFSNFGNQSESSHSATEAVRGESEKTFLESSGTGPAYPWTDAMLAWQRTSYHFQPVKNWMNGSSRRTGVVKWFNDQKGFEFITPDDGGEDLFVHQSSIRSEGFRSLGDGETFKFVIESGGNGRTKAADVTGPNEGLVQGSTRGGGTAAAAEVVVATTVVSLGILPENALTLLVEMV
ncbi:unnamed protein product [Camellia sinensis]